MSGSSHVYGSELASQSLLALIEVRDLAGMSTLPEKISWSHMVVSQDGIRVSSRYNVQKRKLRWRISLFSMAQDFRGCRCRPRAWLSLTAIARMEEPQCGAEVKLRNRYCQHGQYVKESEEVAGLTIKHRVCIFGRVDDANATLPKRLSAFEKRLQIESGLEVGFTRQPMARTVLTIAHQRKSSSGDRVP